MELLEIMLTGGHPNSLGRTEEVVSVVLADTSRLEELYGCYQSADAVVRLRTSSAFKRVAKAEPRLLVPFLERFLTEITHLDQASAQWTLALLFDMTRALMNAEQQQRALTAMKRNLELHADWIVLNTTAQVLARWAADDRALRDWLLPQLARLHNDPRKSVARTAAKLARNLDS